MTSDRVTLHQEIGTLYGVGAGPGAPDLLTLRAQTLLSTCPVICLPVGSRGESYAERIVGHLLDCSRQEILMMRFPMQRERELALPARGHAANEVLERLRAGLDVAFVTEGDPLVYSTFGYLLEAVRTYSPTISVQVIPGVSSITAGAAAACLPLAAWDERIAIVPASYALEQTQQEDFRTLVRLFHSVVLLKVSPVFDRLLDILEELDLIQHAVFVRRCSTEQEEVVFDLARLRGQTVDYFSLVIVRKS